MSRPEQKLTFPSDLAADILSGECIAFVGSGLSRGIYPSWPDLINTICVQCGCQARVDDNCGPEQLFRAADQAKQNDKVKYFETISQVFGRPPTITRRVYSALTKLPFRAFLTTNFDSLLSCARRDHAPLTKVQSYPGLSCLGLGGGHVYHLHGAVSAGVVATEGSLVLSESEFSAAYEDTTALSTFLSQVFENAPICFLGCSLREPTIQRLLKICKDHQSKRCDLQNAIDQRNQRTGFVSRAEPPRKHILTPYPDLVSDPLNQGEDGADMYKEDEISYANLGIRPVWYSGHENHIAMQVALEELAGVPPVEINFGWSKGGML